LGVGAGERRSGRARGRAARALRQVERPQPSGPSSQDQLTWSVNLVLFCTLAPSWSMVPARPRSGCRGVLLSPGPCPLVALTRLYDYNWVFVTVVSFARDPARCSAERGV
jgi:hypothetical protein